MKFTKKAFREALKTNDQTKVWHLASLKLGPKPQRRDVFMMIEEIAETKRDEKKSFLFAYESLHRKKNESALSEAFYRRSFIGAEGLVYYRQIALKMLRRLYDEPLTNYTKVPMFGIHHLYFCHPGFGHCDYNKVCTCLLNGPLAVDKNGNRYDPQASWCQKVVELGNRIYVKKVAESRRDSI